MARRRAEKECEKVVDTHLILKTYFEKMTKTPRTPIMMETQILGSDVTQLFVKKTGEIFVQCKGARNILSLVHREIPA